MRARLVLLLTPFFGLACESAPQDGGMRDSAVTYAAPGEPEGLHRFRDWGPKSKVVQGALPHGDPAFKNLRALGVTTVINVDGAVPDLRCAGRFGLETAHIPIGYDGITREQALQIVKTVRDAEGRVYVHCHHGRHRGPAAAMIARIAVDGISNEEAVGGLRLSGTSPKYSGLFRDVGRFVPPSADDLAKTPAAPGKVVPAGLKAMMVGVNDRYDYLKQSKVQGWEVPEDSPDVSPPHEARMLWELYRETLRLDEAKSKGDRFLTYLKDGEKLAVSLEEALRKNDRPRADSTYKQLKANCNACHADYRN